MLLSRRCPSTASFREREPSPPRFGVVVNPVVILPPGLQRWNHGRHMPHVPSTRNVLYRAPARSVCVGLKLRGLGSTTGCCAVSSDHSGTLLTGLGRRKPEPVTGQNHLQLCPLLILSVVGLVHVVRAPLGRAPLQRGPLQRLPHQRAPLRRAPLFLYPPRAPLRRAPLRRGPLSQRSPRPLLRSPLLLWDRLMVLYATSASAGSANGRGVTAVRRSPRKRTPVSPSRDSSPKKKKTKSSSSSTTSSRKKGGGGS